MKNIIRIFTTIIFLFVATTFSQDDPEQVLSDLQAKFDTITDLSVEFIQSHNNKSKLIGTLFFKKDNKLRINTKNLIVVSDGNTSYSYQKKENKVIISNYDSENDPGIFSINKLVYDLPAESDLELITENGQDILTLIPNSYTYSFDEVRLWLTKDNLISKMQIKDSALGKTEVTFENYKLNRGLQDSDFSLIPPEGSKVIDLR